MRTGAYLILSMVLSACAIDASSNESRDVSGAVLGSAQQRDVTEADGEIYLGMPGLPVRTRRSRALADRYDETVTFAGGGIRYQRLTNLAGFSGSTTNIASMQSVADSDSFRRLNLTQAVHNPVNVVNRYGIAQYAPVENSQLRCAVFSEHFWTRPGGSPTSPGDTEIVGNLCYPKSDAHASQLEATVVELLQNLQLGPGVNHGAPALANMASQSAVTAAPPPPATHVAPAPFKIAPIGTRFVTASGYIQIMRVDGYTVTTVNAANQTARWLAGLITIHAGASVDEAPLRTFFPVVVGKEAVLLERSANSVDAWRHTIKVVRAEKYLLKGTDYDSLVIEVHDQSVNPDQGGFDQTRTFWYAPDLGGLLRMRSTQNGGPPMQQFNWDVVDVVPPKAS